MHLPRPQLITFPSRRVLAMDCGVGHVACAAFTRGRGRVLRLRHFAFDVLESNPALGAQWAESLSRSVNNISRRVKLRGACRMTLPGHHTLTKFVRTPSVEPARRSRIAEFEAQQNIPCPLAEMVWDHFCVADDGTELELMLAAAKRSVVEPICVVLQAAGFSAEQITPGSFALIRGFRYNYPEVQDCALVLSVGARSTHVAVIEAGRFFARTVAFGGNSLTQAVAEELHLEFDAAESLKRQILGGVSTAPGEAGTADVVGRAAERFGNRLHLEILRSIARYRPDGGAAEPVLIYLAGRASLVPGLTEMLGTKFQARVERYDPLRNVEVAAPAFAETPDLAANVTPELVGLAASPGPDEQPGFNLLPCERMADRRVRRRQRYLVAGLVLAVAAVAPLVWHYNRVVIVAGDAAGMREGDLVPLRALVARTAGDLARLERAKTRIAALQGPVRMKSSWINFLGDLQGRLVEVEDVWLEKLEILPESTTTGGNPAARPPLRVALSGRLLDWNNPVSKVSSDSYERAQRLLRRFGESEFVSAVENERFDNSQPGILRFDCTLVINPRKSL
jgi:type IV pilus assembly protein PilM